MFNFKAYYLDELTQLSLMIIERIEEEMEECCV